MKSIGKISSLPATLRDQVNQRLDQSDPPPNILRWLNALPEVKAHLAARFDDRPISRQNLAEYRLNSFRQWRTRRDALRFTKSFQTDLKQLGAAGEGNLSENLARWVAIRYLALAQTVTADSKDDPRAELKLLRQFSADILALRRSDHQTRRANVAELRLALTHAIALKKLGSLEPKRPMTDAEFHEAIDNMRRRVFGFIPEDYESKNEHWQAYQRLVHGQDAANAQEAESQPPDDLEPTGGNPPENLPQT